jgi:hypothetical protein
VPLTRPVWKISEENIYTLSLGKCGILISKVVNNKITP